MFARAAAAAISASNSMATRRCRCARTAASASGIMPRNAGIAAIIRSTTSATTHPAPSSGPRPGQGGSANTAAPRSRRRGRSGFAPTSAECGHIARSSQPEMNDISQPEWGLIAISPSVLIPSVAFAARVAGMTAAWVAVSRRGRGHPPRASPADQARVNTNPAEYSSRRHRASRHISRFPESGRDRERSFLRTRPVGESVIAETAQIAEPG